MTIVIISISINISISTSIGISSIRVEKFRTSLGFRVIVSTLQSRADDASTSTHKRVCASDWSIGTLGWRHIWYGV